MMKKNKFVKLIEHILVALPLLYVGGVALYTTINENAFRSYSGVEDNPFTDTYTTNPTIEEQYYVTCPLDNTLLTNNGNIYLANVEVVYSSLEDYLVIEQYDYIRINVSSSTRGTFYGYYDSFENGTWLFAVNSNQLLTIKGILVRYSFTDSVSYLFKRTYSNGNFLDTSLLFAMNEFNKLGFNKIPFTSFFVNIFHNGETNVYIDFVNNYLNYMLFVECSYFVPMILYWFIHFGEDVIDRFTRKGD